MGAGQFEGVGEHAEAIRYLLSNVTDARVSLLEVDGIEYFSFMSSLQWETTVNEAKRLLAANAEEQWTEDYCKTVIGALLPENATEFASFLWKQASELCVFAVSEGIRTLCAYGRGAEHVFTGVLEESHEPLHYSEIAAQASARSGRSFDLRRAHAAAQQVGLLLGPGTFGLRKHLNLNPTEMEAFAQAAEDLILEGGLDRQWHSNEIVELLSERSPEVVPDGADKYHLDIALRDRGNLRGLGRMVWAAPGALSEASRLEVSETILTVLRMAGRPLKTEEIRQRVCAIRGVGSYFQITASDPLLKIGSARWGLNDRDFSVKRKEQPLLLNEIIDILQQRKTGIHISELGVSLNTKPYAPPHEIFGLSILDSRLGVSLGQYLYLREWGEPRRETWADAIKAIMLESVGRPMAIEKIAAQAEKRLGRSMGKWSIYRVLESLGARLIGPATWQYDPDISNAGDECDHPDPIEGDN